MSKKLWDDFDHEEEYGEPAITETFVLRFTLNTNYSDVDYAAKEVAESVEWMSPQYGSHDGILQVELLDEEAPD